MRIKITQNKTEELDWELLNYLLDLKEEWQKSMPGFSDKELLEIFPEAKQVIPEKIKEWEQKRVEFSDAIKKKLTLIKYKITDGCSQWFWREWVKVNEGQELLKVDGHIARLKRLLAMARGWRSEDKITEEKIQQALHTPIENIINQCGIQLRKCGRNLTALCPFHQEKTPSFFVYPESNSFYCYGCQKGGNTINFVEEFYNFSFKEAVGFLIKNF